MALIVFAGLLFGLGMAISEAVEIAAKANAVNTSGKAAGTIVFDTTNSKIKVATGATDTSTWVDADGTNAVTPS